MGVLEMTQIKSKLINEYKNLIEYAEEEINPHKHSLFLTRALAAYSVTLLYPNENKDNIIRHIVDGAKDNGLDIIYYIKETNELCFVQSKFNHAGNSEPELGDIKKFLDGIRDILQLKFHKFNEKVNALKNEIIEALNKGGLKYKAVLAYTAINLSETSLIEFREFKKEQNNANETADFEIINQKRLYSSLIGAGNKINLEVALKEWGKYSGEMKGFYGHISAIQIFNWYENHGDNLFDLNIRKMLGNTDINQEIIDTLSISPEKFWYFNNGITMICDSADKKAIYGSLRDLGVFDCKGISIVNGAQTIGSIGKFGQQSEENKNKLEEVYVSFRVISIERVNEEGEAFADEVFAKDITKTNNRQNKIEPRDFLVLDPIQREIENQLKIEGVKYYLMREEVELSTDTSLTLREATRALSFAKDIDSTILVRTNPGLIYSDLQHSRYKKLFNPSITGIYIWNCVKIQRRIEECIENLLNIGMEEEEEATLIYSKEVISKIIFDSIGSPNIDKGSQINDEVIDNFEISSKVRIILSNVKEVIKENNKTIPNIFKNHNDMREIYSKVGELLDIQNIVMEDDDFDIYEIDIFNYDEKKKLSSFIEKIKNDSEAFEFFKYFITERYYSDDHCFSYKSNLHFYINDDQNSKATDRFIFRMAYYTKMIISFKFNSFDRYQSILLNKKESKNLIEDSTDSKYRIIINSKDDLERAIKLFNKIFKK